MKKNKLLLFIVFCLCFMFNAKDVFANDIMYDIEKFNIKDGKMIVGGWTFISGADNYGGLNMTKYIVAYGTDGNDDLKASKVDDCKKSGKCLVYELNNINGPNDKRKNAYNFYYSLCFWHHVKNEPYCDSDHEKERRSNLKNGKSKFQWDISKDGIYYKTGFLHEIDLKELYSKLFNYKKIKFYIYGKIRSDTKAKKGKVSGGTLRRYITDMAVNKNACDSSIEKYCQTGAASIIPLNNSISFSSGANEYSVENVQLGKFSSKVVTHVSTGRPSTTSGVKKWSVVGRGVYLENHTKYELRTSKITGYTYGVSDKGVRRGARAYAVKAHKSGNRIKPGGKGTYYMSVAWAKPSGSMTLYTKTVTEPPKLSSECLCVGSDCPTGENAVCPDGDFTPVSCSNNNTQTSEACSDSQFETVSCKETVDNGSGDDFYYYRVKVGEKEVGSVSWALDRFKLGGIEDCSEAGDCDFISNRIMTNNNVSVYGNPSNKNSYYYFPIKFYSNINVSQNAGMYIKSDPISGANNNVNDKTPLKFYNNLTVDAGRYFHFSLSYEVTANWSYINEVGNTYKNHASGTNTGYKQTVPVDVEIVYKDKSTGSTKTVVLEEDLSVILKDSDKIYRSKSNGGKLAENITSLSNIEELSFTKVYESVANNNTLVNDYVDNDSSDLEVKFPNSNDINDTVLINPGLTTCRINSSNKSLTKVCDYIINKAYYDKEGNVYYCGSFNSETGDDSLHEDTSGDSGDDSIVEEEDGEEFDDGDEDDDDFGEGSDDSVAEEDDDDSIENNVSSAYLVDDVSICSSNYIGSNNKGSLYYVPLNMKSGGTLNFTITSENISLLSGITFSYDATCHVNTMNQLKDRLNYKPIDPNVNKVGDLKFSKVNSSSVPNSIPFNWKKYLYDDDGKKNNFIRVQNSFKEISYQTNYVTADQVSSVRSYNNKYGYYSSLIDIDLKSGNSAVIRENSDLFKSVGGSVKHCGTGQWSLSCDKASWLK